MARKTKKAGVSAATTEPQAGSSPKSGAGALLNKEQKLAEKIRTAAQRETVEAFVVAFVLALLFRAFVAEVFVIPTGSMAPTLMGAHKDLFCDQCDHRFQVGASKERRGLNQDDTVVAGICPNCRYVNNLDLANAADDETFNGDRILVSKFSYTINEPDRWDVIVFKFPGNPKQNYIKRLVGLPEETLSIQFGDIYVSPLAEDSKSTMLRKPSDKLLAMRHHVYDAEQQSPLLIESGYPSRLQPWQLGAEAPPADSWKIERRKEGLVAKVDAAGSDQPQWLRYFHHWPTDVQWNSAAGGESLANVDPYSSRLISDFYAYNCYITVPSRKVYEQKPSNGRWSGSVGFLPEYKSGGDLTQFETQFDSGARFGERGIADSGLHWVGDLIVESEIETSADCNEILLEIVESGVKYQCRINLESGQADLMILDGEERRSFTDGDSLAETVSAETSIRAGGRHSLRFSNCDDQLLLWVDDDLVEFEQATTFDSRQFRGGDLNSPRFQAGIDPLDAAPVGIAVRGGQATLDGFRLFRDKYYVATNSSAMGIFDYDMNKLTAQNIGFREIQELMGRPDLWDQIPIWQTRRRVRFDLAEDQFFPMGDNSPESLDARCWANAKSAERLPERFREQAYAFADASYVPRDLLVGKALLVFWPHPWNSPVPSTPNFNRFRLIR